MPADVAEREGLGAELTSARECDARGAELNAAEDDDDEDGEAGSERSYDSAQDDRPWH